MAAPKVDVDYAEFSKMLKRAAEKATPAQRRKYLKNVGAMMLKMEGRIWKSRGAELGHQWRRLSPVTLARRKQGKGRLKGKGRILEDSGNLRASDSGGRFSSPVKGSARRVTANEVTVGSCLPYARTHQFGRGPVTIPNVKVRGHWRKNTTKVGARGQALKRAKWKSSIMVKPHTRTQKWGAIPARPHVGWTKWGIKEMRKRAVDFFVRKAKRKGAK